MKLLHKRSVFIVSGDCFSMDQFSRLGCGAEKNYLLVGLGLINERLREIQSKG